VRYAFDIGAVVLLLALLWTVVSTREYPPTQLHTFADATSEAAAVEPGQATHKPLRGAAWLLAGAAGLYCVSHFQLDKSLFILGGLLAAWGLLLMLFGASRGESLVPSLVRDIDHMPARMRELVPVQFFSWLALFAMWLYTTAAVTREHFGATDATSEVYNDGANWVGVLFGAYNGFAAIAAVFIPMMVKRFGLSVSHMINLMAGAVGLASFAVIRDPDWLLVSMVGVGFAWASILSLPYALLAGSVPSRKMGVYMGIFNFFIVIPQLVAASVLGTVLKHLLGGEAVNVLVVGGASFLIAGVLALRVK
jgi:maltose/moltooligosaccharide transporter